MMKAKNIGLLMTEPSYSVQNAGGSVLVEFDDVGIVGAWSLQKYMVLRQ